MPNSNLPNDALPLIYKFPEKCREGIIGLEMFEVLRNSRLVFNKHAEICGDYVGNMRLFEATGMGTCLISDTGNNMKELFEDDKEIITYRTKDELLEKISYLLDNPSLCENIAKAGQKRTLKDHTLEKRCLHIHTVLQDIV